MESRKSVPSAMVGVLRDEQYRIREFKEEPKHTGPDGQWVLPDGSGLLEKYWVDDGWSYILYSSEKKVYWLTEIEGPDHGVHFFGPFPDEDGSFYRKAVIRD